MKTEMTMRTMRTAMLVMKDTRVMSEGREDVLIDNDGMTVEVGIEETIEIDGMVTEIVTSEKMIEQQQQQMVEDIGDMTTTMIAMMMIEMIIVVDEKTVIIEEMMILLVPVVVPNSISDEAQVIPPFLLSSFLHNCKPIKNVICND